MTFNTYEESVQLGAPVELYEFRSGLDRYYYTSADHDVVYGADTYTAIPMQRGSVEVSMEKARNNMTLKAPRNLPVADLYRVQPPSEVVTLSIFRLHEADPDAERVVIWMGRVLNVKWERTSTVSIHCEPVTGSLARPGLRRLYQRQCPHILYGTKCGLDKADWQTDAVLTAVSEATITAPEIGAFADNYFAGGMVEFDLPSGNVERRFITSNTGASAVISLPCSDLYVGLAVRVYPGCNHTIATCASKFSNSDNFGGFPFIPQKNPMEGSNF